jgi:hypothetical protein
MLKTGARWVIEKFEFGNRLGMAPLKITRKIGRK